MTRITDTPPPNNLTMKCPLINFQMQPGGRCGTLDGGKPCPHYGGLLDSAAEVVASENERLKAMHRPAETPLQILQRTPFEARYRVICGHPTLRRFERIHGMGE